MAERQTNYTIMEGYTLPSEGKIYETKVDSHVEIGRASCRERV